jgi:hypothetical protein
MYFQVPNLSQSVTWISKLAKYIFRLQPILMFDSIGSLNPQSAYLGSKFYPRVSFGSLNSQNAYLDSQNLSSCFILP